MYCKLCSCHFTVSHGGIHDIKRHVDCQKHKLNSVNQTRMQK